jgi:hypothetical protein
VNGYFTSFGLRGDEMIKEKYKQLCLSLQFGGIRTITIHSRYGQTEENNYRNYFSV